MAGSVEFTTEQIRDLGMQPMQPIGLDKFIQPGASAAGAEEPKALTADGNWAFEIEQHSVAKTKARPHARAHADTPMRGAVLWS